MSLALDGNGTSIAFATSGFAGNIIGVDGPGATRETIDCTHLGTVKAMEFIAAKLADAGELSLEIESDPDTEIPIASENAVNAPKEVVTITWPLPEGKSVAATWVFDAICTGYSIGASNGERMTGTYTMKISGTIDITASVV